MRSKIYKITFTFLIINILVSVVYLIRSNTGYYHELLAAQVVRPKSLGDPNAPIHVIEYTDLQCPACEAGARILKQFVEKYPSKFFIEYKAFPLSKIHKHAIRAAVYAECASRQNRFWDFHNLLFATRKDWKLKEDVSKEFVTFAEELSMDTEQLELCVEDPKIEEIVLKDKKEGRKRGVRATPTYYINGNMVVGFKNFEHILAAYVQQSQNGKKQSNEK